MFRPNPETLGTGAAIADFLNEGPCTVLLDELDQVDAEARRRLQQLWNMGHLRGASYSYDGRRPKKDDQPACPDAGGWRRSLSGTDAKEPNVRARNAAVHRGDQTEARI